MFNLTLHELGHRIAQASSSELRVHNCISAALYLIGVDDYERPRTERMPGDIRAYSDRIVHADSWQEASLLAAVDNDNKWDVAHLCFLHPSRMPAGRRILYHRPGKFTLLELQIIYPDHTSFKGTEMEAYRCMPLKLRP